MSHLLSSADIEFKEQVEAFSFPVPEFDHRAHLRLAYVFLVENDTDEAVYTVNKHNIYLTITDPEYPPDHPRNREVSSSKGCITTDQVPAESALHTLYESPEFRDFLCAVLDEEELYEYADPLSSINLHYAGEGQELGWHFDNSSFAITLMIQSPESGGHLSM